MFFERGNLFADRRLPCPKLASDRRKAPAFDDAHEYLDAFEPIHPTLLIAPFITRVLIAIRPAGIKFGIFGCEVVRNTRKAVAVMPRVLAISRNAGPITIRLGFCCLASTIWQARHASRAKGVPGSRVAILRMRAPGHKSQNCGGRQPARDHWH
jgi:hypothetical protein